MGRDDLCCPAVFKERNAILQQETSQTRPHVHGVIRIILSVLSRLVCTASLCIDFNIEFTRKMLRKKLYN
jgi:hypothetical protein